MQHKERKSFFNKKEVNLLRNSNMLTFNENASLRKLVLSKNIIYKSDILEADIPKEDKTLICNTYKDLYQLAFNEWVAVSNYVDGSEKCALCGAPNKLIFYIENKINNQRMNVGSECIKGFKGYKEDFIIEEYTKSVQKNILKIARKNALIEKYGDVEEYLRKIKIEYNNFACILPEALNDKYVSSIEAQDEFLEEFLSNKKQLYGIGFWSKLMNLHRAVVEKATLWWEENKANPLVCTRAIAQWITRTYPQNFSDLIEQIRSNDGLIPEKVACRIFGKEFIEKNLSKIQLALKELFINISFADNRIYLTFKKKWINKITITCSAKDFMETLAHAMFGNRYLIPYTRLLVYTEPENSDGIINFIGNVNKFVSDAFSFKYDLEDKRMWVTKKIDKTARYLGINELFQHAAKIIIDIDFADFQTGSLEDNIDWAAVKKNIGEKLISSYLSQISGWTSGEKFKEQQQYDIRSLMKHGTSDDETPSDS